MSTDPPQFDLARLREIGWEKWDPIGLRGIDLDWETDCPGEYDRYMQHAAKMLWDGSSDDEVTVYLIWVASEHMGLSHVDHRAAADTAAGLRAYIQTQRN